MGDRPDIFATELRTTSKQTMEMTVGKDLTVRLFSFGDLSLFGENHIACPSFSIK